jgi:hypothetical protein
MLIAIALLTAAAAAPLVSRRVLGDFLSPPAIIVSTWFATLGLFAMRLLPYPPLGRETILIIAAALVSLLAGQVVAIRFVSSRRVPPAEAILPPRHNWWVALYGALGLAGTAWYIHGIVTILGPQYLRAPLDVRHALFTYQIPSTFLFLQLFCVAAPLLWLALRLSAVRIGGGATALAWAAAACTLITTDRTQLFTLVLAGTFMLAFRWGARIPLRLAAGVGALTLGLLVVAFLGLGAWHGRSPSRLGIQLTGPGGYDAPAPPWVEALQPAAVLYMYATASYAAFDIQVAAQAPSTRGKHTFFPVLRPLQRAGWLDIDLPSPIAPFVPVVHRPDAPSIIFNTYTFLYYPYADFGAAGAVAYSGVIGLVTGLVYVVCKRDRRTAWRLLLIGQMSTALALAFFVNKFNNTASWYIFSATMAPFVLDAAYRRWRPPAASGRAGSATEYRT